MAHTVSIETAEVGLLAQIIQQQKSLFRLRGMHHRRIQAEVTQLRGNPYERPGILLRRGRIHRNARQAIR